MIEVVIELKGYALINEAIHPTQYAVQAYHIGVEVYHKNRDHKLAIEWAENHKTAILLGGGYHGTMVENYKKFRLLCRKLELPYASFTEDYETMNNLFTGYGAIIPSTIYDMDIPPEVYYPDYTGTIWCDMQLAMFLKEHRLLR